LNTLTASSAYAPQQPAAAAQGSDSHLILALLPSWTEIVIAVLAVVIYGLAAAYEELLGLANYAVPVVLSAAAACGVWIMMQRSINTIWTMLFWFRVALISFFGVGSLVPLVINESTLDLVQSFFLFFPQDVLKYNAVIAIFYLLVLLMCRVTIGTAITYSSRRAGLAARPHAIGLSNFSLKTIGIVFLAVGISINYLLIYPNVLGMIDSPPIGIVAQASQASLIGYFMITYWSLVNKSRWIYVVFVLAAIESFMGLIQLTKFATLFPWVMIGIGFIYYKASLYRIGVILVVLVPAYFMLAPMIAYGRNVLYSPGGSGGGLTETVSALMSYDSEAAKYERYGDVQNGWARLSYVNAGTFAIDQYDKGLPGNSLRHIFVVLIPRLIYPNKPIITDVSRDFTFLANGNWNSSSSPGIPAEAYWTAGWIGVGIFSLLFSLVMTGWSIYSLFALQRQAWHLFFVVLLGMRVGTRLDGMLVADIIGPVGIAIVAHVILQLMNRFLPRRFLLDK